MSERAWRLMNLRDMGKPERTMEPTTEEGRVSWLSRLPIKHQAYGHRLLEDYEALEAERDAALALLRRAALGEEPQIRAYHEPPCGQCLGCQARALLAQGAAEEAAD